jgi:hypothetical protein
MFSVRYAIDAVPITRTHAYTHTQIPNTAPAQTTNLKVFKELDLGRFQAGKFFLGLVLQVAPIFEIGRIQRILNLGNIGGLDFLVSQLRPVDIRKPGVLVNALFATRQTTETLGGSLGQEPVHDTRHQRLTPWSFVDSLDNRSEQVHLLHSVKVKGCVARDHFVNKHA